MAYNRRRCVQAGGDPRLLQIQRRLHSDLLSTRRAGDASDSDMNVDYTFAFARATQDWPERSKASA